MSQCLVCVILKVSCFLFYCASSLSCVQCIEFCFSVARYVRFVPSVFPPVPHPLSVPLVYLSPASSMFIVGSSVLHPVLHPLLSSMSQVLCSQFQAFRMFHIFLMFFSLAFPFPRRCCFVMFLFSQHKGSPFVNTHLIPVCLCLGPPLSSPHGLPHRL